MPQQEVVDRRYQFRLVADESIRKVLPEYLAALAVKARSPGELQQLPLQLATALHQAHDRRHNTAFQTSVEGGIDAIGEWSTALCGTPIRPCFDSDMNGWAFPSDEPHRLGAVGKNARRQQVQNGSARTGLAASRSNGLLEQ
jgi:hypothetical protein